MDANKIDQPAPYTCKHSCERDALKDEVHRLRSALGQIADGSVPRPIGHEFDDVNGLPSSLDKCFHGKMMYEECDKCVADYAKSFVTASSMNPT